MIFAALLVAIIALIVAFKYSAGEVSRKQPEPDKYDDWVA